MVQGTGGSAPQEVRAGGQGNTLSLQVLERIKADILGGRLEPDAKLRLNVMRRRYGIGTSPLREALSRLAAQGLVSFEGQRGFRVAPVSRADLEDITLTRQMIEPMALRLAIENGDDTWEAGIITAFHLFKRGNERGLPRDDAALAAWEERHRAFHAALVAACPLTSLKDFFGQLYDKAERYRRVLLSYDFAPEDVIAEHRNLMQAVLDRRVNEACETLINHIALTADIVSGALERREKSDADRERR